MKFQIAAACVLSLFLLASPLCAADAAPNTPVGYWKTIDDHTGQVRSIVRIFELNGELRGRIEKLVNLPSGKPNPTCEKCPGSKKDKPVLGLEFMWGFKRDGASYSDGAVLDPEEGRIYNAQLEVLDGGKRLKLFGYVRLLIKIGRSQTWERVSPADWGLV